jgi:hypothetical protein
MLVLLYFFIAWPRSLDYVLTLFAPFSATATINFGGLGYNSNGRHRLSPRARRRGLIILTQHIAFFGLLEAWRAYRGWAAGKSLLGSRGKHGVDLNVAGPADATFDNLHTATRVTPCSGEHLV